MEHGLINYLDSKAKCRHLKTCKTCKGTLRQVIICLFYTPHLVTHCLLTCTYSHIIWGRGELSQREGESGNRLQNRVENTNMTECAQEIGYLQSINSDK
jgi:hypothetical protein